MNVKGFFVTALSQALDLGIASPDDVLRHVTPEVLSEHLPRPLWARLITACMGAPRVDAQLVVETIGVPNLCEHMPSPLIWACIKDIAQRSLGEDDGVVMLTSSSAAKPIMTKPVPLSMTPPPAEKAVTPTPNRPTAVGPSIPAPGSEQSLADVVASLDSEAPPSRSRTPTGQRFRQSNTGIGRLAANNARRPQAAAPVEPPPPPSSTRGGPLPSLPRRSNTDADAYDVETEVGKDDWKSALAVEDEQLVDWSAAEETATSADTRDDTLGRNKR